MKTSEEIIDKLYELKIQNFRRAKNYNFAARTKCVVCDKFNTMNIFKKNVDYIAVCSFCEEKFNNIERTLKLKRINGN